MSKNKAYAIGVVLVLIGWPTSATSFISAVLFSIGFVLILYGYTDMISHKNKDPYKYL